MKILDCTLRDGGYYTNWDFQKNIVDDYFESTNNLPIEYLEIGYRSKPLDGYLGEFFYCPDSVIDDLRQKSNKKLAVMINEKDVTPETAKDLLTSIIGKIDLVRMAVNPMNFERALNLGIAIKKMGFKVGFNVMYMSKWAEYDEFKRLIKNVNGIVEYFYMVDSFGGVYPNDIIDTYEMVRSKTDVSIGFHGHNNLELGLINTLTAIECGVEIVDATITGMGRGAGNLKTELLLTALNAKEGLEFDFNALSKVVDSISELQEQYGWGTNLPYIVSGANSLPQKEVMEWVGKRFYSYNSIIRTLNNKTKGLKDNIELEEFKPDSISSKIWIVGGGESATIHSNAIREYLVKNQDIVVIHSSSKNVNAFRGISNRQIHCLTGNEGYRLENLFNNINTENRMAVLPPFPRTMGTYIPTFFNNKAFQLKQISFTDIGKDSVTSLSIQTALDMGAKEIVFIGYDGYQDDVSSNEIDLFNENENLFVNLHELKIEFFSLTPSVYNELPKNSIYSML